MDSPGPGSASSAVTTTKVQRTGAAEHAPSTAFETLKHVYSGITLNREHLATVLGCLRDCCRQVDIHANTFHLTDLDELEAVFSEDKIIENLRITAIDPHDGEMSLVMELGYIEIEASNASWAPAFRMIVRLLEGIPKNGTQLCGITMRRPAVSAGATAPPAVPTVPLPPKASTPTALAMAAMTAAAKPLPAEHVRTQAGDRQKTIASGAPTGRIERPRAPATAALPRTATPSPESAASTSSSADMHQRTTESPVRAPASAPTPAAAPPTAAAAFSTPVRITARTLAPMFLHLAGDLALVAGLVLGWRRAGLGSDLPTALLAMAAALCIGSACVWTLARASGQRDAPRR